MAGRVQIQIDSDGIRQLLRSDEVGRYLEAEYGQPIANEIRNEGIMVAPEQGGGPDVPIPVAVSRSVGRSRQRVVIALDHPAGLAVEARHRPLGRRIT